MPLRLMPASAAAAVRGSLHVVTCQYGGVREAISDMRAVSYLPV